MTLNKLIEYIADFTAAGTVGSNYDYIELSLSRVFAFRCLIEEAIDKIFIHRYYQEFIQQVIKIPQIEKIKAFLEFCRSFQCHKTHPHPPIRGPCALSYDFYLKGGAYLRNSYFLFGTPSQFRV